MLNADWLAHPAAWSYGLAALFFGAFAVHLSARWKGDGRSALLLAFVLLSAFWALTSAVYVARESLPLWWSARLFDAGRMLAAVAFLATILAVGRRSPALSVTTKGLLVLAAIGLSVGAFVVGAPPPGIDAELRWSAWSFAPLIALSILGLVLVEHLYRRAEPAARWSLRPLVLALGGIFLFDLVLYADAELFRFVDPHLWAARGMAHAFAIPLLALAAARNPQWSFGVALSRGMMVRSTALMAAAVYLLLIAGLGYFVRAFGGSWGNALATLLVFGAVLFLAFLLLSETFRAKMRVIVAKNFFAYRYDYREEWLKFTRALSITETGTSLTESCVQALANLVESPGGLLWLRQADGDWRLRAHLNAPAVAGDDLAQLPAFLQQTGWVIDLAAARADPTRYVGLQLPAWLERIPGAWLIVPLPAGDELIGFVVLLKPRVQIDVNWEVQDLLRTAGRQASSYLAHMQATDALLEARKFEAFNRMSAFVVHDLKNLVTQLQLMLRNAERHRANPEFQRDMLRTVEHAVERMNHMMRQLRSGETPVENPRAVDLAAVARRVQMGRANGRPIRIEARDGIVALGHEDRLERVLGHLVQNALDAAGDHGLVTVRVAREEGEAVVEVSDNGPGMTDEFLRERLFKPFQTTKPAGMGIGAYESHQYIRSLGGRMVVDSAPGKGTTVRVLLRVPATTGFAVGDAANSAGPPPQLERAR